jgi:phosphoglycolate phosphatase
MVGDTPYDVLGARSNGLGCIAVGYGYGTREALEAARPLAIADSVAELGELLL